MPHSQQAEHEWFEEWFDDTYLALYQHRNTEEARQLVRWLASCCSEEAGRGVLDLACGAGRHAWTMAEEFGWRVFGLDLSTVMLKRALSHRRCAECPQFIRGDLRNLPFRSGHFGLVVNLFTSFGYFEDDREHLAALHEMRRVLHPQGKVVLDLMNPAVAVATLIPSDETRIGQLEVEQHRTFDRSTQRITKTITIQYPNGNTRKVLESVRLFSPAEIDGLLAEAGLDVTDRFGGYSGSTFISGESERMILLAGARS